MNEGKRLGTAEFLTDIWMVITSPSERFSVIHERGALWGSLLLLIAPAYFGFTFAGGVYFERDPFPGYSFILPAVVAAVFQFLKVYIIHFLARLFEGREHRSTARDEFRGLLVVFGYTSVPATLSLILATLFFSIGSPQIGSFFRNFRVVSLSIMFAIGIALFLWNLILLILAMRSVYALRDVKLVAALLIGLILAGSAGLSTWLVVKQAEVDYVYLEPILSQKIIGIFKADPMMSSSKDNLISIQIDILTYHFKSPIRFELVAFSSAKEEHREGQERMAGERNLIAGRIVGLPGDAVELAAGKLRINGQLWAEPYIIPEFQSSLSMPLIHLGPSAYLILPDDRRLVDTRPVDIVVHRDHIVGRLIVNRWPIGWGIYRPNVFLHAHPAD